MITIVVDSYMLINKMMSYYIILKIKLFLILCKWFFEILKLNILIVLNLIF